MPAHPRFPIAPDHDSNGPHDLLQRRSCWLHLLKLGGTVIGTVATGTVRHEAHPSHAGPLPDRVAGVLCVGRWRGLRHSHRIAGQHRLVDRSEEHTSELQSLMRISYAVFCSKKTNKYTRMTSIPYMKDD